MYEPIKECERMTSKIESNLEDFFAAVAVID
jgi:hypothetical protein